MIQWINPWSWYHSGVWIRCKLSSQRISLAWWCRINFNRIYSYWIFHITLIPPIISNNTKLILHGISHVYTWWIARVMPVSIIINYGLGDNYNPTSLNIPISCIYFLKSQNTTVSNGFIWSCPVEEVTWRLDPYLLPQNDHRVSCTYFFHIFRRKYGLCNEFSLIRLLNFGTLIICRESLGGRVLFRLGKGMYACLLKNFLGDGSRL